MTAKEKAITPNKLIAALAEISAKLPRAEKVLIVPDYSIGHQFLENLARSGTPWINFNLATTTSLAMELVEDQIGSQKLELISGSEIEIIIDNIFNDLADSGQLKYFKKLTVNKGLIAALTRAVRELRLAGLKSSDIDPKSFVNLKKGQDIVSILSAYEKFIKDNSLVDTAALIEMALKQLETGAPPAGQYLICSRHYSRGLEKKFITKFTSGRLIVIDEDPVFGLEPPADLWASGKEPEMPVAKTDIERLGWIYDSSKSPAKISDGSIEIFSAAGARNEVRAVLRRIVANNIPFDDVEIIYTDAETYLDLLFSTCEKMDIPATLAEGVPAYLVSAGRALDSFLLWIKYDFAELYLRRLLESGSLKFASLEEESLPHLGHLLRTSGVGWGRERYPLVLSKKAAAQKKKAADASKEGWDAYAAFLEEEVDNYNALNKICGELLALVPASDKDNKIDFASLCDGCANFLKEYVRVFGPADASFAGSAAERIASLAKRIRNKLDYSEAVERLFEALAKITVAASGPLPGHLHLSHYRAGGRSGRQNTFIVGLDEGKFPQKSTWGTILLDNEKNKISRELELSAESLKKNVYDMAGLLAGLRGKTTFSYSYYAIKEERNAFPSSLILQAYRLKESNPLADYNALLAALKDGAGFAVGEDDVALDETDWWLNNLLTNETLKDGTDAVKSVFPGVEDGLVAREARQSDNFTIYDGKVKAAAEELDPRLTHQPLSCSRIESAAKCPFAYFIRSVLHVELPEETEIDFSAWLDAAQRGQLLHKVFELYFKEAKSDINKLLDKVVAEYKDDIPPPSEAVFINEYNQLKRDVQVFLRLNDELGTVPVATELFFGDKTIPAAKIPLGKEGYILLRGSIDRLDHAGKSNYSVWDYKTGGTYYFREEGYVVGGEQVQHALYAVAAEEYLRKIVKDQNAGVTESGYLFPTEKGIRGGYGYIFRRSPARKAEWQQALNLLFDLLADGAFMVNPEDNCLFCDYVDICGGKTARKQMAAKLENPKNKLDAWQELKEYE